jgi:prefoldin subunit 5
MKYSKEVQELTHIKEQLTLNSERLASVAEFVEELAETKSSIELYTEELEDALTDPEVANDSVYCNDLRKSIERLQKHLAELKQKKERFDTYLMLVNELWTKIPDVA